MSLIESQIQCHFKRWERRKIPLNRTDIALKTKIKETFRGAGSIADFLLTKFTHHKFNETIYVEFLSLIIKWAGKMKQIVSYAKQDL